MNNVTSLKRENEVALKKITNEHNLATSTLEGKHKLAVQKLKDGNELEIQSLRSDHERKIAQEIDKKENILQELKKSLDLTKKTTDEEIQNLKNNHSARMQELDSNNKAHYKEAYYLHQEKLNELEEEAAVQNRKLNKAHALNLRQTELKTKLEESIAKEQGQSKIETTKADYSMKALDNDIKYSQALRAQENHYKKTRDINEALFQKKLTTRMTEAEKNIEVQEALIKDKEQTLKNNFETKYEKTFKENEEALSKLLSKKEKILEAFNDNLIKQYKVNSTSMNSDFKSMGKIESRLEDIENGYRLIIPINKEDKDLVSLSANGRELKLSMTRNFEHSSGQDSIKKTESMISKIATKDLINPNSIKSKYEDGNLIYEIKKA